MLHQEFWEMLKKRWKDVNFWLGVLIRLYFKSFSWWYLRKSKSVLDEEWDDLIILDACRYDIFKKRIKKKENLRPFYSLGSNTREFLIKNFKGKKLKDIIYIASNPFVNLLVEDSFYKVIPLWKTHWNEKYGTVLPRDVVAVSKKIKKKYPEKRQIIHFMQPHYPFVKHPEITATISSLRNYALEKEKKIQDIDPWILAKKGKLSIKKVWKAYEDNLDYVLPYALDLALWLKQNYNDSVVITADHGNAYKRILFPIPYVVAGHPCPIYIEELIKVPWYKV